jgi:hypothetical protein
MEKLLLTVGAASRKNMSIVYVGATCRLQLSRYTLRSTNVSNFHHSRKAGQSCRHTFRGE